eukprot:1156184-Pelagomonas_calceolata.AAC.4
MCLSPGGIGVRGGACLLAKAVSHPMHLMAKAVPHPMHLKHTVQVSQTTTLCLSCGKSVQRPGRSQRSVSGTIHRYIVSEP